MKPTLRCIIMALFLLIAASVATTVAMHKAQVVKTEVYGDFLYDTDPALQNLLDGDVLGIYAGSQPPLMMPLGIISRWPGLAAGAVVGADLGDPETRLVWTTGFVLGLSAFLMMVAALYALRDRPWPQRYVYAAAVGLLVALNPVTIDALRWGHAEELMMASLLAASVWLLASRGEQSRAALTWAGILFGMAVATKQPALLAAPAMLCLAPVGRRLYFTKLSAASGLLVTLPFLLANPKGFFHHSDVAGGAIHGAAFRAFNPWLAFSTEGVLAQIAPYRAPLIMVVSIALAVLFAHRWKQGATEPTAGGAGLVRDVPPLHAAVALICLVMLLRCVLDSVNNIYYHTPFVLCLVVLEFMLLPRRWLWTPLAAWPMALFITHSQDGIISHTMDEIGSPAPRLYVFVMIALAAVLGALAFTHLRGVEDRSRRRSARVKLYAGAGALLAVSVAALLTFPPTVKTDAVAPPLGWKQVSVTEARSADPVWWAGPQAGILDLRATGSLERALWGTGGSFFLYSDPNGENQLTVATIHGATTRDGLERSIERCKKRGRCRRPGDAIRPTPLGDAFAVQRGEDLILLIPVEGEDGVVLQVGSFGQVDAAQLVRMIREA